MVGTGFTGHCATLSTASATWTDLGLNLVLLGERLAAICLRLGMVLLVVRFVVSYVYINIFLWDVQCFHNI